ncbi:hypothetical protein SteCoe_10940 [Stentor coeruleus]|uniref:Uncharacterized protein n=1 Tax=Stentor coeruleus TaxID=5963 RepID=A0A1R2CEF7_9CILI|nr:hypothetical protein SteCoe_10940 [Stentor coeruleus]
MAECFQELTLLLSYQTQFSENTDIILNQYIINTSPFWEEFLKFIKDLKKIIGIDNIAKIFQVPHSFISLILSIHKQGAECLLCEKYYEHFDQHLIIKHNFTEDQRLEFYNIFEKSFFPIPKSVELAFEEENEPANMEKISKNIENAQIDFFKYCDTAKSVKRNNEERKYAMCIDCGQIMTMKKKLEHDIMHKRTEKVECLGCQKICKRKKFDNHLKICPRGRAKMNRLKL